MPYDNRQAMAMTLLRWNSQASAESPSRAIAQPAAVAGARVSRATLALGGLGLVSAGFVVVRLFESWRVTAHASSHRVSIFGQQFGYPTANLGAIVIVALAALGLIMTFLAIRAVVRELAAVRRFHRRVAGRNPRPFRGAVVIDDERLQAFCAGLVRPCVYVSTGAVELLDDLGLEAVLAHERHHARRRDPLRVATGRVLAQALFLLPGLRELIEREQSLAELGADESAVNAAPANRSGLAGAMLSFSDAAVTGYQGGIDPTRVDYLLGESPSWRFPLALCTAAAAGIALLLAIALLAGQVAHGSATLAPPFLSRQPCVVVLALIPAAVGVCVAVYGRRVRTRWARRSAWPPPLAD
jgi:Zn-dependent protease with chaperone function